MTTLNVKTEELKTIKKLNNHEILLDTHEENKNKQDKIHGNKTTRITEYLRIFYIFKCINLTIHCGLFTFTVT
jgi:hypothetical protein